MKLLQKRKGFTLISRKAFQLGSEKAFTLIELLVVIAIIGILAALIIVSLQGARQKASDTQLKNNARNIDTGLAQYYTDHTSAYPANAVAGTADPITSQVPPMAALSSYITGTAVYNHPQTDAKYLAGANNASYAQAWSLQATTEQAITSGNGVYGIATGGTVTAGNALVLPGMKDTDANSLNAFVTYGPQ